MKKNTLQPQKVNRVRCKECGELLTKVYPWAIFNAQVSVGCGKCQNKIIKNQKALK